MIHVSLFTIARLHTVIFSVLNIFKAMVRDENIFEKEDMYILDYMREFLKKDNVYQFMAAKQVLELIVRSLPICNASDA